MYFLIKTKNAADLTVDEGVRNAHRAYLEENVERILAVGLTSEEREPAPEGSAYIIQAENWADARTFMERDPLTRSGARASVELWQWKPRGYNRQFPLDGGLI